MGYPLPPLIEETGLVPSQDANDVEPNTAIKVPFKDLTNGKIYLVNGGTVTIGTLKGGVSTKTITVVIPDSQITISGGGSTLVVSLTDKTSKYGSYGALSTHDAELTVAIGAGAVKTCNTDRCSGFPGMVHPLTPYRFFMVRSMSETLRNAHINGISERLRQGDVDKLPVRHHRRQTA